MMVVKFGIRQKLALIFFVFFLIFTGTLSILILDVSKMMSTTTDIVTRNNKIDGLCDKLHNTLQDMDTNSRKLTILNNPQYSVYFTESVHIFEKSLAEVIQLIPGGNKQSQLWKDLQFSYQRHKKGMWDDPKADAFGRRWVTEQIVHKWSETIEQGRIENQHKAEASLLLEEERGRQIAKKGLLGATFTVLAGMLGMLYISRSILAPLHHLAKGLQRLPANRNYHPLQPRGGIEFQELITTFNNMSLELSQEDEIRNEFIASLSHEIRTPLSSIRESVNMVVEEVFGPVSDKQKKFLTIAVAEIGRINRLLDHLLRVSILDTEEAIGEMSSISASALVTEVIEQLLPLSERKSLKVSKGRFSCHGKSLFGMVEEFRQVFHNIIGNGIKYSPQGESVLVNCRANRKGDFLIFEVIDHGSGIAEEELSLIFTRYYRTRSVRGYMDGVGLGLPIARKIITSYGGTISASNNREGGTTFTFSLPTRQVEEKDSKAA